MNWENDDSVTIVVISPSCSFMYCTRVGRERTARMATRPRAVEFRTADESASALEAD